MNLPPELILSIGHVGTGLYFSVAVAVGLGAYLRFRRVRGTELLTWPGARPRHFGFLVGLGVLAALLTVVNGYLARPLHHLFGLGIMAVYFVVMVPLGARIRRGLYREGVWAEGGFVPYRDIGRLAFREGKEIVLLLLPRGRSRTLRLPVPPSEYGAVRKVLADLERARVLTFESAILGL